MPIITKNNFKKYVEHAEIYLEKLENIDPSPRIKYSIKTLNLDVSQALRENNLKHIKEIIKKERKNIANLLKTKENLPLGFVHYEKIHTLKVGDLPLSEFPRYLSKCIDIYSHYNL